MSTRGKQRNLGYLTRGDGLVVMKEIMFLDFALWNIYIWKNGTNALWNKFVNDLRSPEL